MSTVITVENLSKKYTLHHQQREQFTALKDVITNGVSSFGKKLIQPFRKSLYPQVQPCSLSATEEFWALKDVSFEVKRGDRIGIIGRNGAGKSTLLKILSRITEPTTGNARIKGRVASLLEVGTGFHPELTGRENIFLNGAILGMTRAEIKKKFDEIVDFAGIEKFLDTPVKRYSSGMYVRLAFAVAAHLEPEILLVDEVLAVGDIEFQRKCVGRMENVSKSGCTVLIVSHSMSSIKALCPEAILLEQGRVKLHDNASSVIDSYFNLYQADSAEKIITEKDHVTGVNQILVKKIILSNVGASCFRVYWQEKICISLEIVILKKVSGVAFGSGIRTIDGVHIFTVHHDDDDFMKLWDFEPGDYRIDFELQNNLRPGLYKLHVGADIGHISVTNILSLDAVNIEVMDHSKDGSVPLQSNTGVVIGHSNWSSPEKLVRY